MKRYSIGIKLTSVLLVLAMCITFFIPSAVHTAYAISEDSNYTPTEAENDSEIQAITDSSTVLNESDIIYMILTDRFYVSAQ